jgi:hypothetical protein
LERSVRCSASRKSSGDRGRFDRSIRSRGHVGDSATIRCTTSESQYVNRNFSQSITVRCTTRDADPRDAPHGISTRPRATSWVTWALACSRTGKTRGAT